MILNFYVKMTSDSKLLSIEIFHQTLLFLGLVFCNGGEIKNIGKMKMFLLPRELFECLLQ